MIIARGSMGYGQSRPSWLVTFADLVALLLTFFVMLFATHRVEQYKWTALIESLSQSLNPHHEAQPSRPSVSRNIARLTPRRATDLSYLEALLQEFITLEEGFKGVVLRRLSDRIVIAMPADSVFAPGRAQINAGARKALFALGGVLRNIGNRIEVHGHADPNPLGTNSFGSNWELSLARAAAVAGEFRRTGYGRNIRAFGFSDTRYGDLFHIASPRRRYALARRVDVIILATKGAE